MDIRIDMTSRRHHLAAIAAGLSAGLLDPAPALRLPPHVDFRDREGRERGMELEWRRRVRRREFGYCMRKMFR